MDLSASRLMPVFLLPVLMVGMWCFVSWLLSRLGGWHRLAKHFPLPGPPSGQAYYMQRGSVGWVRYRGCLTIRRSSEGLFLSVLPLFRVGHPPCFLPWTAVRNQFDGEGFRGAGTVMFEVEAGGRIVKLRLPKRVFEPERIRTSS